jgi:hypothetical protein
MNQGFDAIRFDEIRIVDLDLSRTTWSRVHSAMRTLYLRLSREPESQWVRFFHEERESRIVIKRHGLWIEDGYVVFDCMLDDVETHHLPDFRLSVAYANAKYREFLAARAVQGEQVRSEARDEQAELAALRERIRRGETSDAKASRKTSAMPAAKPSRANGAAAAEAPDFEKIREEWRARFRTALASRPKEPNRGND